MAVPVIALLLLLTRAATSIITRPTLWLVLLSWFAVSRFDFGEASHELQQSIAELWWLVVLIAITAICNTAIRAHFHNKRGR